MEFNAGPINNSVLYDQPNHVSDNIWNGIERGKLKCIQGKIACTWKLTKRQLWFLEESGFIVFGDGNPILNIDSGLISTLVERWRSETNSFHFAFGEATITLQDVGHILGLPIIGNPITARRDDSAQKSVYAHSFRVYESQIPKGAFRRGGVKLTYLLQVWSTCPEDADDHIIWMHTKAYILYCIGKVLFPTSSKNVVHTKYLQFLENPMVCRRHAWGAAVLAYAYRALYRATRKNCRVIACCLILIQVWSYERIHIGRPLKRQGHQQPWLRAFAWELGDNAYLPRRVDPHHHHVFYRGEFDLLQPEYDFEWEPYLLYFDDDATQFNEFQFGGCVRTPLIHFDIVEWHLPERVTRQFGMDLEIPKTPTEDFALLRVERDDPFDVLDPYQTVPDAIDFWNAWQDGSNIENIYCEGNGSVVSFQKYQEWYKEITRKRIHPPQLILTQRYQPRALFDQGDVLVLLTEYDELARRVIELKLIEDSLISHAHRCHDKYEAFKEKVMGQPSLSDLSPGSQFCSRPPPIKDTLVASHDLPQVQSSLSQKQKKQKNNVDSTKIIDVKHYMEDDWDKGHPRKSLSFAKFMKIERDWWSIPKQKDRETFHYDPDGRYALTIESLKCLRPRQWLYDDVMDAYIWLLRDREMRHIQERRSNKSATFIMRLQIFHIARLDLNIWMSTRKTKEANGNVVAELRGIGQLPLWLCDIAFFPFHKNAHFALIVVNLRDWDLFIIDPLYKDTDSLPLHQLYKEEVDTVNYVIGGIMSLEKHPPPNGHDGKSPITWRLRPQQPNGSECGVFVLKFIDYISNGLSLGLDGNVEIWNEICCQNFRSRIAWELYENRPRHLIGYPVYR